MFADNDVFATIAVKDLNVARPFYEETLGLKQADGEQGEESVRIYRTGNTKVMVYTSQFAGTNKATAATWIDDDVDATVKALKAKGVTFEHYDFPDSKLEGDVHVMGTMRAAWFKDPDGNILALVSR